MRRFIFFGGVTLALVWGVVPSFASRADAHRLVLGIVPVRSRVGALAGVGNLAYHGGPVMHVNTTYAVYWIPSGWSMVSGYRSGINRYFADAAADSGKTTNVYSTETQFYDTAGHIAYTQRFGGSTTATDAFPASGCPRYSGYSVCLTDAQVVREIKKAMAFKGWTGGLTHAFFLFLPKNVGTCTDGSGSQCAFTSFCAYHSFAGTGSGTTVYANMPYSDTAPAACGAGQRPNGGDSDDTLNVTSHEHREMIEDLLGNAWYDAAGYEGSDKCAWTFGAALGSTSTGKFNQVINGHDYWLQEEWSNATSGCVQRGY